MEGGGGGVQRFVIYPFFEREMVGVQIWRKARGVEWFWDGGGKENTD